MRELTKKERPHIKIQGIILLLHQLLYEYKNIEPNCENFDR